VDVSSEKDYSLQVLLDLLPPECDILCRNGKCSTFYKNGLVLTDASVYMLMKCTTRLALQVMV